MKQGTNASLATHSSLGGGVSIDLKNGEQTGRIEKIHLVINRILRREAEKRGIQYLDMGTDYYYPFYDKYEPTQKALQALSSHVEEALHYPSSYGLITLRESFQDFMKRQFNVKLDANREIMINTGASQAFDALSRAYRGKYVLLPELSLPTVSTIAKGNGAKLLRLPANNSNRFIDLNQAGLIIQNLTEKSIRFLYLNSPCNPNGEVANREYLEELVKLALKHNILILHDMDSWYTVHKAEQPLINILEIPGAKKCSVTVFSLSKEFGLSGLRVGLMAGNEEVINTIRMHNSTFCVMIPDICQHAAKAALDYFNPNKQKPKINKYVTSVLKKSIEGWKSLGWPEEAIGYPYAGFKYLISVPPNIKPQRKFSAIELFDYYIASRMFVKLSNSLSFNPENNKYIRMILMQRKDMVDEVFRRMRTLGVHYQMELPKGLSQEYSIFIQTHINSDL